MTRLALKAAKGVTHMTPKQRDQLVTYYRDTNKLYRGERDDWARGLRLGMSRAIEATRAVYAGQVYDDQSETWKDK